MKALPFDPVKLLQNPKFCLFGTAVGLSVLHLSLSWRLLGDTDQLILNVIFWGALLCVLWGKQDILNLESDTSSSFFGLLLIALVLLKSISLFWFEAYFLKVSPLLVALGLGLLASGVKGLKQYWRELLFVLLLCIPEGLFLQTVDKLFNVSMLTAKFAVFILWYLGFEASGQGINVVLPKGYVYVETACTGTSTALLLIKFSVLFILTFPTDWLKKILVLLGAVFIAFITSVIRVALMAVFVSNKEVFDYWHGPQGNQVFTTTSILIFGLLCRGLLQLHESASPDVKLQ